MSARAVSAGRGHSVLEEKINRHDLKVALKEAGRQQNAIRKSITWQSELTAFEQPAAQPKQKGVRGAIRRGTQKLRKPPGTRPCNTTGAPPSPLERSFSFDFGDERKERKTTQTKPVLPASLPPHPRTQLSAKTQLQELKAQQKQRRAAEKAASKARRQAEKSECRRLARQAKHEHSQAVEYILALASRHPRQALRRIREGGANDAKDPYWAALSDTKGIDSQSIGSPEPWTRSISGATFVDVGGLLSPYIPTRSDNTFYKRLLAHRPKYSPPAYPPRLNDFRTPDALQAYLRGRPLPQPLLAHRTATELPAYQARPAQTVHEAPTDLPEHDENWSVASRAQSTSGYQPQSVYCDICSGVISLSSVFYYCTLCGPRDGGIVCSGCQEDNRRCHGGLHDLESSIQLVRRLSPHASLVARDGCATKHDFASKAPIKSDEAAALSTISAESASHSLGLATMQKKMTRLEACIDTNNKTTEKLASWLEDAMERQKELAAEQTDYILQEMKAKQNEDMHTLKRLSTKRKPKRRSSVDATRNGAGTRDNPKDREISLRERELALRERAMALEERKEGAKERVERSGSPPNPLPSQGLANMPAHESRIIRELITKLNRVEALTLLSLRQPPNSDGKLAEEVVEKFIGRLSHANEGFREHAPGVKRKAESTGASNSAQLTPTTGTSNSGYLQLPSRNSSRRNSEDDEEDGHSPKRPRIQPTKPSEDTPVRLLACPYSKFDFQRYSHHNINEQNYRGCSSCYLTDISRLKQHLYRVHQTPKHHCPRCFEVHKNQQQLSNHIRQGGCQQRECPFPERFPDDSQLRKKWPGKSIAESWYMVYRILFPGHRIPASPYAEDLATGAHIAMRSPSSTFQPGISLAVSPEAVRDVSERVAREQLALPLPFSSSSPEQAHAFLRSFAENAITEVLRIISASPTPITNSNPSSAIPGSGTLATSPGPESALAKRFDSNIDPELFSAVSPTFNNSQDLCDLSSLGSGVTATAHSQATVVQAHQSDPSSGSTFHGLSPLSGIPDNLMDDLDRIQVEASEIAAMAPLKASNSQRTMDSGYGTGSNTGLGGISTDSLLDAEMYRRLRQDHGDDGMGFEMDMIGGGEFFDSI